MQQGSLFDQLTESAESLAYEGSLPNGLVYVPNFVSIPDEFRLLGEIDGPHGPEWSCEFRRRVKHFGFRYNYKARAISMRDKIGDLPGWAQELSYRLVACGYFTFPPEQLIVNEYEPGQGISPHIDRETCFGPVVASLSLGSDIVMDFEAENGVRGAALLPARCMIILSGDARYGWKHGIAARKQDSISHLRFARHRRISLTFRTILIDDT